MAFKQNGTFPSQKPFFPPKKFFTQKPGKFIWIKKFGKFNQGLKGLITRWKKITLKKLGFLK